MGIEIITALIASAVSVLFTLPIVKRLFRTKKYSTKNGTELLSLGKAEQWNELRQKNPNWLPSLDKMEMTDLDISYGNFSLIVLQNSNFRNVKFQGANFSQASLLDVNFEGCDLTDAIFIEAKLSDVIFKDTILTRTNFSKAFLRDVRGVQSDKLELPTTSSSELLSRIQEDFEKIDELAPMEFENLVAELFEKYGYSVELVDQARDIGYDMRISRKDIVGDINMLVEVKKYRPERPIGLSVIRAFLGSMMINEAGQGLLVTSSNLSSQAEEFVKSTNAVSVIDRNKLREMIVDQETLPKKH